MSPPGTLRERLTALGPVPRKTWTALIKLLRARKKRTGEAPVLATGLAALTRTLDTPAREDGASLGALHAALRGLHVAHVDDVTAQDRAAQADALLARLAPTVRSLPTQVTVAGWHPSIPSDVRAAIVGRSLDEPMSPVDAAVLRHELDGLDLGGHPLRVSVAMRDDEVLPAPPRDRRGGPKKRGDGSWLPHVDAVGAWSTTPEPIADAHAQLLKETGATSVIDLFCGCGGDAIACARAGLSVIAVEREETRAQLARRNADALGVAVAVRVGDGLATLGELQVEHPGAALFVDPPWGGAEAQDAGARAVRSWKTLLAGAEEGEDGAAARIAAHDGPVLLKLPRDFAVDTLPGEWELTWQLGTGSAARVVKAISALRQ